MTKIRARGTLAQSTLVFGRCAHHSISRALFQIKASILSLRCAGAGALPSSQLTHRLPTAAAACFPQHMANAYALGSKAAAALERWNRERTAFVSTVSELAREGGLTVAALEASGAIAQVALLLHDTLPHVAHTAAFALGRMAHASEGVACTLVDNGVAATLVEQLAGAPALANEVLSQEPCAVQAPRRIEVHGQHRAALFALRSIARHSPDLAAAVLSGDGLAAAAGCLGSADAETREGAAALLEAAAGHGAGLAAAVAADPRVLPLLVAALGGARGGEARIPSPSSTLPALAASTLASLAKADTALARGAVEAGALQALMEAFQAGGGDAKLQRQLAALASHIARASPELCGALVGTAGLLPALVACLSRSDDPTARRFVAAALREVAKGNEAWARALASVPSAPAALVAAVQAGLLPAVMCAGFVGGHSGELSQAMGAAGLLPLLVTALAAEGAEEHVQTTKAAAVWALGQLGKHDAACAMAVAGTGALPRMVALAAAPGTREDLRGKCEKALAALVSVLEDVAVLAALLELELPREVMSAALARCAAVLEGAPAARALFVQAGALRRAEELGEAPNSTHADVVRRLCSVFPEEVVSWLRGEVAAGRSACWRQGPAKVHAPRPLKGQPGVACLPGGSNRQVGGVVKT